MPLPPIQAKVRTSYTTAQSKLDQTAAASSSSQKLHQIPDRTEEQLALPPAISPTITSERAPAASNGFSYQGMPAGQYEVSQHTRSLCGLKAGHVLKVLPRSDHLIIESLPRGSVLDLSALSASKPCVFIKTIEAGARIRYVDSQVFTFGRVKFSSTSGESGESIILDDLTLEAPRFMRPQ